MGENAGKAVTRRVSAPAPAAAFEAAAESIGRGLKRSPGRNPAAGPLERQEFAPAMQVALRIAYRRSGAASIAVATDLQQPIRHWNRAGSEVDVVVQREQRERPVAVAELKVWDIGHQLFDLVKCCCLLAAGAESSFLACIAKDPQDYGRLPGGELFPSEASERRTIDVPELLGRHSVEWSSHVGGGGPEPKLIPAAVTTTAVGTPVAIEAYPGHQLRTVQVETVSGRWLAAPL